MENTVIYQGHRQTKGLGGFPMIYGLLIEQVRQDYLVTFTELENNGGASVTNVSEQPATQTVNEFNLEPDRTRFFEKYTCGGGQPERIDCISYEWQWIERRGFKGGPGSGWRAGNPEWHHMIG